MQITFRSAVTYIANCLVLGFGFYQVLQEILYYKIQHICYDERKNNKCLYFRPYHFYNTASRSLKSYCLNTMMQIYRGKIVVFYGWLGNLSNERWEGSEKKTRTENAVTACKQVLEIAEQQLCQSKVSNTRFTCKVTL